ncbi:MAG: hypothetical protein HY923_05170 [Elusimicrobia bacterium]|nr:hypothetical protein [Elusimicrobiota bacterium]
MGARRTIGPAAIAAALIGAGLALYRPVGVPRLLPGARTPAQGVPPGSSTPAALASALSWPAPRIIPPSADSADSALRVEKATSAQDAAAALERAALRDAPADFPYATSSARAGSSSASAPALRRPDRRGEPSPDSGESGPTESSPKKTSSAPPQTPSSSSSSDGLPAKRALLSKGPAPVNGEMDEEATEQTAVDVAGGASRRAALASRRRAAFPLFRPPKRSAAFKRAYSARRRRVRPLLLAKLLGRGALRPPPSTLKPPDLTILKDKRPSALPEGAAVPTRAPDPLRLETLDPRKAGAALDRRQKPHWDAGPLWHDGEARGLIDDARWLWLWTKGSRWWAAPEPDGPPLLHHHGLWWSKRRGVWFVQHEGEPWTWRRFAEWDAEGLVNLRDGVQLLYSADFTKVAVLTPGEGAVLYDAATGEELGQWLESELPRRRPRPPSDLRLPRGI